MKWIFSIWNYPSIRYFELQNQGLLDGAKTIMVRFLGQIIYANIIYVFLLFYFPLLVPNVEDDDHFLSCSSDERHEWSLGCALQKISTTDPSSGKYEGDFNITLAT